MYGPVHGFSVVLIVVFAWGVVSTWAVYEWLGMGLGDKRRFHGSRSDWQDLALGRGPADSDLDDLGLRHKKRYLVAWKLHLALAAILLGRLIYGARVS